MRGDGRLVWLDEEIVIMSAGFGLCSRFLLVAVAVVVQYEETGEGGNGEFDGAVMKKKRRGRGRGPRKEADVGSN